MIYDKSQSNKKRIEYIDLAKGLLITLVVIGHALKGTSKIDIALIYIINCFHIPAFFIISGLLVNRERIQNTSLLSHTQKKFKRLIIPYICFELIGGFWQMLWFGSSNVNLKGILAGILTIRCHVGADWFLPTLFMAEILLWIIIKKSKQDNCAVYIICLLCVAFILTDVNYVVANIRRISVSLAFVLIGNQFKDLFITNSKKAFILSTTVTILIAYLNKTVSIAARQFNNPILFVSGGIAGSYMILYISRLLVNTSKIKKLFMKLGCCSLVIMGTHQNVIIPFNVLFENWTSIVITIAILFITVIIEFVVIKICENYFPSVISYNKNV